MTEYQCSVCSYTSSQKAPIIRHINRIKSCGSGIKEVLEIAVEIKCDYCNKSFSTAKTLAYHIKNNCSRKDDAIREENRKLKEENKLLKESVKNITFNDNRVFNIMVVNYEDTKLNKLSDKAYNKIIKDAESHQIIPRLIKAVHFNPDIPENHNIYISNKNDKHIQLYRDNHWEITDKDTEIDNLINDKETNLSDWIDEKGEKYPEALEKFNEYLEQKYDEVVSKLIKEEVKMALYNNRHLIKLK
jgi:gas vesicle protein